jgi:AcrR family transcriptional regulator
MIAPESGEPMQRTARRTRNGRSHRAILNSTSQLLAEVGYSALTIEGVAARARVGKATVYRWWPSKGALAIEALHEHASVPPTPDTGNLRTDLIEAVHGVMRTLATSSEGAIIAALAADLVADPGLAEMFRDQILRPRRSLVAAMINRAAERGDLPPDVNVPLILDTCAGAVFYRLVLSGEPLNEDMADQLVDLILNGARPRAAAFPG